MAYAKMILSYVACGVNENLLRRAKKFQRRANSHENAFSPAISVPSPVNLAQISGKSIIIIGKISKKIWEEG